jgi:DNA-directed RNA polymerase specialized sigma24 family protein
MSALALPLHDASDSGRDAFRRTFAEQLARLPDLQARAFRMRDIEGWPPARICAQLGVSDETLAELLYDARSAMCRALAREGFGP